LSITAFDGNAPERSKEGQVCSALGRSVINQLLYVKSLQCGGALVSIAFYIDRFAPLCAGTSSSSAWSPIWLQQQPGSTWRK